MFAHGSTFAGHPVAAAVALANIDDLRARGPLRPRARQGGRVPRGAGGALRHPDRRRRSRRRLLPRDRAGQGQGDEGVVRRRGVRGAAARLPLRRALQARPDLPRRRPRRPGDPARAAADRRHRAVRGDRRGAAAGAGGGLGSASSAEAAARCSPSRASTTELDLKLAAGGEAAAEREIRWVHISELADPTPWLSRRRAAADDRDPARQRRAPARVRAPARRAASSPGSASAPASTTPSCRRRSLAEAEALGFPLFEVPYEMPFIAITEAAANQPRQRAVRRALARDRRQRAARAAGPRGRRPRGDRPRDRLGGRRQLGRARRARRAARPGGRRLAAEVVDAIRDEVRATRLAAAPFVPVRSRPAGPGPRPSRLPARRRAPRPGWWWSAAPASSATSSGSASSRRRSWSRSS